MLQVFQGITVDCNFNTRQYYNAGLQIERTIANIVEYLVRECIFVKTIEIYKKYIF